MIQKSGSFSVAECLLVALLLRTCLDELQLGTASDWKLDEKEVLVPWEFFNEYTDKTL